MKLARVVALALMAVAGIAAAADPAVYTPAEAIALAKARPSGRSGRFAMTVMATGKTQRGTFLHSTADYRADDNLTFRLTPPVADLLARRYGQPPVDYLKGKRVVVDGVVGEKPIVNTLYGAPRTINRFQHEVEVTQLRQLVSVGD